MRRKTLLVDLAVVATLLGIWQGAAFLFPGFLLPGVWAVTKRLIDLLGTGEFYEGVARSFLRLGLGYGTALFLGTTLGLLAGLWSGFRAYLRSLIAVLQSVPPITWVPFLVILFGFGDLPIVFVVSLASFFPMAHSVMSATESVDPLHLQAARVLGGSPRQILISVYLPEVFPSIVTGAQISFGNAWRSLVAAEMIAGVGIGLGWSISYAGEIADMPGVLANIVVIGFTAALIDRLVLEKTKHALLKWRYA